MTKHEVTDLDVREDGVYVLINYDSSNVKKDILNIINKYQLEEDDIDFSAIEDAIRNRLDEKLISTNTEVKSYNESIDINISQNKMKVKVKFSEPVYKGTYLTVDDILNALLSKGIRFGVNKDLLTELTKSKEYEKWYEIAYGVPPEEGEDGYTEYFFTVEKKTLKPKELNDGTVDYRNIGFYEIAKEGQVLAVSHPAILGKDGLNVLGQRVAANKVKKAPGLPKGKNTKILDDGITLVAETAGRIFYMDGHASILPVLEISGNVDNTTGNIDFIGSVLIKGSVVTGFTVIAGGDIEVEGPVEGAILRASGNILLIKGVQGANKAIIEAGGDINANFIENSDLYAGGDINANSIMHSVVRCGNNLTLTGSKRGVLVGGKAIVANRISARIIGSSMATLTELEVGVNPELLEKYKIAVDEMENLKKTYEKTEKIIEVLSKSNIIALTPEKKKFLMESIRSKIVLKSRINDTQLKINLLLEKLNIKNGRIDVNGVLYSGAKVTINNAVLYVRDNLNYCSLYNDNGKVCIGAHS